MNLTYGNIKKSKVFKYIYLDLPEKEYKSTLFEYENELRQKFSEQFLEMRKFFHDSEMELISSSNNVTLRINLNTDEKKNVFFIFHNGKIASWNKIKSNGHISRLNKKVKVSKYLYEEFYEDNDSKYVSIILSVENRKSVNIGNYYPYVTIKYDSIEVKEKNLMIL